MIVTLSLSWDPVLHMFVHTLWPIFENLICTHFKLLDRESARISSWLANFVWSGKFIRMISSQNYSLVNLIYSKLNTLPNSSWTTTITSKFPLHPDNHTQDSKLLFQVYSSKSTCSHLQKMYKKDQKKFNQMNFIC